MQNSHKIQSLQQTYCQLIQSQPADHELIHRLPKLLSQQYQIYNLIGEGSYGKVYSAIRINDQVPVAIKVVDNLYRDLKDCKRIYRELMLLKQFKHPNIVKLYDYYFNDNDQMIPHNKDEIYLIMEYLPQNLSQYFETNQKSIISSQEILAIFYQILQGVNYLNTINIIHRDLRPQNILIGAKNEIKICDFNLARQFHTIPKRQMFNQDFKQASQTLDNIMNQRILKDKTNHIQMIQNQNPIYKPNETIISLSRQMQNLQLTETQTRCCNLTKHVQSRFYRAPEIILLQDYQLESDIWSLGCIFAELLQLLNLDSAKGPIFQGSSCYPLSPLEQLVEIGEQNLSYIDVFDCRDQLIIILKLCGSDIDSQDQFLDFDAWEYMKLNLQCIQQFTQLKSLYPCVPIEIQDFLRSMLSINLRQRPSSSQLLQNDIMKQFNKINQVNQQGPIYLKIDEASIVLDAIDMKVFESYDDKLLFLQEFSEINQKSVHKDILKAYLVLDDLLTN